MIKNILFDLGGVLYHIDYSLTKKAFESLGVDNFDAHFSQKQQSEVFDRLETGKLSPSAFLESMKINLPKANKNSILSAWNAMLLGFPKDHFDFLKELSKTYRIYLLSNTNSIHIQKIDKEIKSKFGVESIKSLFNKTYLSHEIGRRKPNRETFEWVLADANIEAKDTLYIDDSSQHIESAKGIGIKTMLWTQNKPLRATFLDKAL